jgi:hypothetical protein
MTTVRSTMHVHRANQKKISELFGSLKISEDKHYTRTLELAQKPTAIIIIKRVKITAWAAPPLGKNVG